MSVYIYVCICVPITDVVPCCCHGESQRTGSPGERGVLDQTCKHLMDPSETSACAYVWVII